MRQYGSIDDASQTNERQRSSSRFSYVSENAWTKRHSIAAFILLTVAALTYSTSTVGHQGQFSTTSVALEDLLGMSNDVSKLASIHKDVNDANLQSKESDSGPWSKLDFSAKPDLLEIVHDNEALTQTRALLTALHAIRDEKKMLFGHEEDNVHGQTWQDRTGKKPWMSDIHNWTGSYPAIFGYAFQSRGQQDFDYSPQIKYAYEEQGAVIEMLWAAYNPLTKGDENNLTKNACQELLPGGSVNHVWVEWMDSIAEAFRNLTDSSGSPIPVIFRIFHEVTGDWYWWGHDYCNASDYKEAWKYTQGYLRDVKDIHQLLYVYAPASPSDKWDIYMDYYPGDDYVDIIGYDRYDSQGGFPSKLLADCRLINSFARERGKVAALAETGITAGIQDVTNPRWFMDNFTHVIMDDEEDICQDTVYALTWINKHKNDYWVPIGGETTYPSFKEFVDSKYSVFANDLEWTHLRRYFGYSPLALSPSPAPTSPPTPGPTPGPTIPAPSSQPSLTFDPSAQPTQVPYPKPTLAFKWTTLKPTTPSPSTPKPSESPSTLSPTNDPSYEPTPKPSSHACVQKWGKCSGLGYTGGTMCCDVSSEIKCYEKDISYSECREDCPTGWECDKKTHCVESYSKCDGEGYSAALSCCSSSESCFRKDSYYSECRTSCPSSGWNCSSSASSTVSCVDSYEKCAGDGFSTELGCCTSGESCYEKDSTYSECRTSCPDEWSCDDTLWLDDDTDDMIPDDTSCASSHAKCDGDSFDTALDCCTSGESCYEKDSTYSQCRTSCPDDSWACYTTSDTAMTTTEGTGASIDEQLPTSAPAASDELSPWERTRHPTTSEYGYILSGTSRPTLHTVLSPWAKTRHPTTEAYKELKDSDSGPTSAPAKITALSPWQKTRMPTTKQYKTLKGMATDDDSLPPPETM